nr:MAG TPA: Protein of unknown function (DUF3989) [Bacteriophage sp.]
MRSRSDQWLNVELKNIWERMQTREQRSFLATLFLF